MTSCRARGVAERLDVDEGAGDVQRAVGAHLGDGVLFAELEGRDLGLLGADVAVFDAHRDLARALVVGLAGKAQHVTRNHHGLWRQHLGLVLATKRQNRESE